MIRYLKFNAVGILGACIQLTLLAILTRLGMNYLLATALAVEAAILHNYVWHTKWTWRESTASHRFWRFQLTTGSLSLMSNLVLMRLLSGTAHLPTMVANLIAITTTSLANYLIADLWIFTA